MSENNSQILDVDISTTARRRSLLPVWIKIFCWFFMITGAIAVVNPVFGLLNWSFHISLYGLETYDAFSPAGIFLTLVFLMKGITGYALWSEKDRAVRLAQVDAISGILICLTMMIAGDTINGDGIRVGFRFELLLCIAYVVRMNKIEKKWKEAANNIRS